VHALTTSGLPLSTDILRVCQHVSKVPNSEVAFSFDHLVGAEEERGGIWMPKDRAVAELMTNSNATLAHVIVDKAEQACRRSDALEKRRMLMDAWSAYCEPKTSAKHCAAA
jgi:hypothetical protein